MLNSLDIVTILREVFIDEDLELVIDEMREIFDFL